MRRVWLGALLLTAPHAMAQTAHTLDVELRGVEFLAGETLTPAERDAVIAAGRARHAADPANDDAQVDLLAATLAPLPNASPADIARGRENMMDFLAFQPDQPSRRPFLAVVFSHNPILARDETEQQVLTGRELNAYLDSFDAVADMLGVPRPNAAARAATATEIVARFKTLDAETRERLEDGEYRAILLRDWLARLTPAQVAAYRAANPSPVALADAVARFTDLPSKRATHRRAVVAGIDLRRAPGQVVAIAREERR